MPCHHLGSLAQSAARLSWDRWFITGPSRRTRSPSDCRLDAPKGPKPIRAAIPSAACFTRKRTVAFSWRTVALVAISDDEMAKLSQIHQLQPLVLPQPSQTWQEPAGRILVPQVMHRGESTAEPVICSSSSADVWAVAGAGLAVSAWTLAADSAT